MPYFSLASMAEDIRDQMITIRKSIIKSKPKLPDDIDLDTPTILRTGKAKLVITNNE